MSIAQWNNRRSRPQPEGEQKAGHGNVSGTGGGKVSVPVSDIVNSPKVQRQVAAVKELASAAPDSGMPETPNLDAALDGMVSGHISEWPAIRSEIAKLKAYALALRGRRAGDRHD
jgi:hypothetical protein